MPTSAPTLTGDAGGTYLVLRIAIAHDHTEGAPSQTRWCADVADAASPLAGLYAFAESQAAARDAIATLAWAAVVVGELRPYGIKPASVAGIHLVTTTCDVYEAAWLANAVGNDAA